MISATSSNRFTLNDFLNINNDFRKMTDKQNNPHGSHNQVVRLDNFQPGTLMIYRQFMPGTKPVEVSRVSFKQGQNRLSLDKDFRGVVIGVPKDGNEKYHFEYIGFNNDEIRSLREKEEHVNRK